MSSIYDIAGTTSDSFSMNGKCTFLQGDPAPEDYQGLNGDIYFQSNGSIYAKRNGTWLNLTSAALPDANTGNNQFIITNGENYELFDLPVTDIAFKSQANTFTNTNTFNDTSTFNGTTNLKTTNITGNITSSGTNTWSGVNTFTQVIQGTAYRAQWGDLAEYYESDKEYPKGTLVKFGGEKEITIADTNVNAVITSEPGFILNNQMISGQAIALVGRVPVRVIGKCNKFDYLTLSNIPGVATKIFDKLEFSLEGMSQTSNTIDNSYYSLNSSNIIARALENKNYEDEGLILCVVKLEL